MDRGTYASGLSGCICGRFNILFDDATAGACAFDVLKIHTELARQTPRDRRSLYPPVSVTLHRVLLWLARERTSVTLEAASVAEALRLLRLICLLLARVLLLLFELARLLRRHWERRRVARHCERRQRLSAARLLRGSGQELGLRNLAGGGIAKMRNLGSDRNSLPLAHKDLDK